MYRHRTSSYARNLSAFLFTASTAVTAPCADQPGLHRPFQQWHGRQQRYCSPAFWNTLISGTGTATEGSGGAPGSLLLESSTVKRPATFPFTEIASPLLNLVRLLPFADGDPGFGLELWPQVPITPALRSSRSPRRRERAGPDTEYPAQDGIALWVDNPNNPNGQVVFGLKLKCANAQHGIRQFRGDRPTNESPRRLSHPVFRRTNTKLQTRYCARCQRELARGFYDLSVSHDTSSSDPTQLVEHYQGGLLIPRSATAGWGTAANPQGDSVLNVETQLNNVTDTTAVAPFSMAQLTVGKLADLRRAQRRELERSEQLSDPHVQHPNGDGSTSNVPNFAGGNAFFGTCRSNHRDYRFR